MDLRYNSNGYLVPGFHKIDTSSFTKNFVDPYPTSSTRGVIFDGYCEYCNILSSFDLITRQWINGSYVTKKLNPNDIDFVNFVDCSYIDKNQEAISFINEFKINHEFFHEKYKCDSYFVTEYPEDDDRHIMYKESAKYWSDVKSGVYSNDKYGTRKGIVEIEFKSSYFNMKSSGGDKNDE